MAVKYAPNDEALNSTVTFSGLPADTPVHISTAKTRIDPRPKSIGARRFAHLTCKQRNSIYREFLALIETCEAAGHWPRVTDFLRLRNRLADKYGVNPYVITGVYNHLSVQRSLSR
jgi:hypothetical protein